MFREFSQTGRFTDDARIAILRRSNTRILEEFTVTDHAPITPATLALLQQASTATITTQLFQRGIRSAFLNGVTPLNPRSCRFVGEAVTLRSIPAREDIDRVEAFKDPNHPQRRVIEMVGPGQVLVLDCRSDTRAANLGGILITRVMKRGAAAVVSDGALRDSPEIERMDFPVFAVARSATLSLAVHHAVDINVPVGCAGVAVYPGDILAGDEEGVVVIPRYLAAEIAAPAAEQELMEQFILEKVQSGAAIPGTYPPSEQTVAEYQVWKASRGF